jgi:hypothetical protein
MLTSSEFWLAAPFEIDCAAYRIQSASIGHGRKGAVFRCTLSPVDDALVLELDRLARSGDMLRLAFPQRPLLLERIEIRRIEPGGVRLVGHVVDPE